ncbi:DUF885 domain-containing protein [candidate division WOR-3 bacterium]|nr:DUF885 domain-containing protein [candidate division WOR-3 bacterium]
MKYFTSISAFCIVVFILFCVSGSVVGSGNKKAPDIQDIFTEFFREYLMLKPETCTELKLPDEWGIRVDHGKLDDVSVEAEDRLYALYEKYRDVLQHYDESGLSQSELVTRATLLWFLDDQLTGKKYRYHVYIINPMFGFHNQLTTLMTEHHPFHRIQDAENYIERLEQYPTRIEQLIEQIEIRKKKRMLTPRFIIETFVAELDSFIAVPAEENVLYATFERKVSEIKGLDEIQRTALMQSALRAIELSVYPAYKKMMQYIKDVKFFTDEKAGVWKMPDGVQYYEYCLQHHTTTRMTPEEIHDIGLMEVERIQGEIRELYGELGINGSGLYAEMTAEYWQRYYKEPYVYPAGELGAQQTIQDYQSVIDDMYEVLPSMFATVPHQKVHVERVPMYKERTAGTYYQPASFDPASEGIFYANLSYPHFRPNMKTLTYHEAIPGHHLQFAIEKESTGYHPVKSLFFITGYAEGWALYAEKLVREYHMYSDVHEQLGNLRSELFRAVRLVVDTGIHWKKWPREQAYEYMQENTGWAGYGEIDRYIAWPGQACAYKIGELTFLTLRDIAQRQIGNAFDIKTFHTAVLEHGSVPLDILEELVEEYIDTRKE